MVLYAYPKIGTGKNISSRNISCPQGISVKVMRTASLSSRVTSSRCLAAMGATCKESGLPKHWFCPSNNSDTLTAKKVVDQKLKRLVCTLPVGSRILGQRLTKYLLSICNHKTAKHSHSSLAHSLTAFKRQRNQDWLQESESIYMNIWIYLSTYIYIYIYVKHSLSLSLPPPPSLYNYINRSKSKYICHMSQFVVRFLVCEQTPTNNASSHLAQRAMTFDHLASFHKQIESIHRHWRLNCRANHATTFM